MSEARGLLRHAIATLAYRAAKAVRGAPDGFGAFHTGNASGTRTPAEILAHMGDLIEWAVSLANGDTEFRQDPERTWERLETRFFDLLSELDQILASERPLGYTENEIFQGPIADAIAHTGQMTMLRRMANAPVRGESYFRARIEAGRVGREQSRPLREFD